MCYDIHFCTANLFLNRARARIGLSARLIGTGFAVTSDYLREIGGFNTITITEDAEFFAICAVEGEKIAFCENAITYDEQALDFKTSLIQRKRWMSGIMQVLMLKFKDLSIGLFRKKSAKYSLDTLAQFSFAYVQALLPFALLLRIVNAPGTFILKSLPAMVLKGYQYVLFTALVVSLLEKRLSYSKNVIGGILMYPFFVLSFVPLQTLSLFKRTVKWEEMEHTGIRLYADKSKTSSSSRKKNDLQWPGKESEKSYRTRKGLYFRVVRKLLRFFLKRKMIIDEKIFMKENVLVGHHQNFYGPISCLLYLPDTVNIWVASSLVNHTSAL